jgi:hypothetical protein
MGIADFIGGRGEAIAFARLTKLCREGSDLPYFWPHFLGEKCETFDFLVELVEISEKDVRRMVAYPAPTYVVGVHEEAERAFVIAIHGAMCEAISSITTVHELTPGTLRRLWDEVRDFWRIREMAQSTSSFSN